MSDIIICPMCGQDWWDDLCPHLLEDYVAEIARLKAELEKAERDSSYWRVAAIQSMRERDEARKWARYLLKRYRELVKYTGYYVMPWIK